ncbi:hypothetical protein LTS15_006923 [Exophiala xenobiotica]|nr:hypothetical protein LTS15_006923 [Exophiala xenobiotica]
MTILPLWGALSDVFLFLVHESNFSNQDETYRYRRAILFACHPQRLFYEPVGSDIARLQDSITSTATEIAKDGTPCTKDYFLEKKWRDGSDLRRQIEIKALGTTLKGDFGNLQYADKEEKTRASSTTDEEDWGCYFSSNPYSNDDLRRLLPSALRAVDEDYDKQWNDPSDFPEAVQEWFKGQKHILFYDSCIHSTSDIAKIFETSYMPTSTKPSTFLLRDMLRTFITVDSTVNQWKPVVTIAIRYSLKIKIQDGLQNAPDSILLEKRGVTSVMANYELGSLLALMLHGSVGEHEICNGKRHQRNCKIGNPLGGGMSSGLHVCEKKSIQFSPSLRI